MLQLKYLRQLHSLLTDPQPRKSPAFRDLIKWAKGLVASLFERLDPPPVQLPAAALLREGNADGDPAAVDVPGNAMATDAAAAVNRTGDDEAGPSGGSAGAGMPLTAAALEAHNRQLGDSEEKLEGAAGVGAGKDVVAQAQHACYTTPANIPCDAQCGSCEYMSECTDLALIATPDSASFCSASTFRVSASIIRVCP